MQTDIIIILDESGSMISMEQEPVEALNSFIKEQSNVPGKISIYTFNSEVNLKIKSQDLSTVKEFNDYHPSGLTALYDSIGKAVTQKLQEPDHNNVHLVIITDGENNASKEYTSDSVSMLLKKVQKENNWTVTFLGANIDVKRESARLSATKCQTFDQRTPGNLKNNVELCSATIKLSRQRMSQRDDE